MGSVIPLRRITRAEIKRKVETAPSGRTACHGHECTELFMAGVKIILRAESKDSAGASGRAEKNFCNASLFSRQNQNKGSSI